MRSLEREDIEAIAGLVAWAWDNDIRLRFERRHSYGDEYPVVVFSRNDKHVEQAFWPISCVGEKSRHIWQKIGFDLCVEPPKFLDSVVDLT